MDRSAQSASASQKKIKTKLFLPFLRHCTGPMRERAGGTCRLLAPQVQLHSPP